MTSEEWIGVDLDGTLAIYPSCFPEIGPPIAPMVDRVKRWLAEGKRVKIFTARVCITCQAKGLEDPGSPSWCSEQEAKIEQWCIDQFDQVLQVTCVKDYLMVELWDDRAIQMIPNTGMPLQETIV